MVLAEHLHNGRLCEKYDGVKFFYFNDEKKFVIARKSKKGKCYFIFPQVERELPYLFSEFERQKGGIVIYKPNNDLGVYGGIQEFFGLD